MEFSENVTANTQAYVLVISDRMVKFKRDVSRRSVLFKTVNAIKMEHIEEGEVVLVRAKVKD